MARLLACDLDGTLLGDEASLREFVRLLDAPRAPILAFATGRQAYSAIQLLAQWGVGAGSYLIAGVGSEMYRRIGKRWMPLAAWPDLHKPWDPGLVRRHLLAFEDLRPQPLRSSSAYKLSYFSAPETVERVRSALREADIDATLIHSHGDMLDVLPAGVDKGSAVAWLARHLTISLENTITCGNTTNDIAMLRLACASVIVGGSDEDLLAQSGTLPQIYLAKAVCAGGIIEGLRAFGWLDELGWT